MKTIITNETKANIFEGILKSEIERAINHRGDYHHCGWLSVQMDGGEWESRYIDVWGAGGENNISRRIVIRDLTEE